MHSELIKYRKEKVTNMSTVYTDDDHIITQACNDPCHYKPLEGRIKAIYQKEIYTSRPCTGYMPF